MSNQLYGNQRENEDAVGPRGPVEQAMVVQLGHHEHAEEAKADKEHLLVLKAGKARMHGGGVDFG